MKNGARKEKEEGGGKKGKKPRLHPSARIEKSEEK